jgi:hypothetical protein
MARKRTRRKRSLIGTDECTTGSSGLLRNNLGSGRNTSSNYCLGDNAGESGMTENVPKP